jgi:hypothetical protein
MELWFILLVCYFVFSGDVKYSDINERLHVIFMIKITRMKVNSDMSKTRLTG